MSTIKRDYRYIKATARMVAFDDNGAAEEAAKKAAEEAAKKAAEEAAKKEAGDFTPEQQKKIDAMLADQAGKAKKAMAELDALKARTDLTDSQRKEIEERYENMQKELLTKEELFEKDKKKKEKEYSKNIDSLTTERDSWRNKFTESTIVRAITDASVKNDAFDSDTICAILRPSTQLIESLDEDKNPNGQYETKVKFLDPEGKDGKPTELLLTVSEAVKRMSELDKYAYLFKGKGAGGAHFSKGAKGGKVNLASIAKDPAAYRKARKDGLI